MRTGDRITRSSVGRGGVESWDSTPGWEWRVERVVRCVAWRRRCSAATGIVGILRRRTRDTAFWRCAIAWHGATLDTVAGPRRRPPSSAAGKRRLFTATPLRAGYYGSVQLTLGDNTHHQTHVVRRLPTLWQRDQAGQFACLPRVLLGGHVRRVPPIHFGNEPPPSQAAAYAARIHRASSLLSM